MNLSTSQTGSSSCRCTTTLRGDEKGNTERCEDSSQTVAGYVRRFPRGNWSFLGPGTDKKWYGTYTDKPDGSWDRMTEEMMLQILVIQYFVPPAPLREDNYEAKEVKEVYTLQRQ